MPFHVIAAGESLSKIARHYGLDSWRDIYDHRENAQFRLKRPDPDLVFPGDRIFVPVDEPDTSGGAHPCAELVGLLHAPAFHVGQEPRSGDCGFFAGYVAHLIDRHSTRRAGSIDMTAEDVYKARNRFYPGLSKFGLGPSDLGYPGLYEPEMLGFLKELGTHFYVSESSMKYVQGSDMVLKRDPRGDRDVTLLAIHSGVAGHWMVLLGSCIRSGTTHYLFYDPAIQGSTKVGMMTESVVKQKKFWKSAVYRRTPVKRPSSGAMPF